MKKLLMLAAALTGAVVLTGCGSNEKQQAEELDKIKTAITQFKASYDNGPLLKAFSDLSKLVIGGKLELTNPELALVYARYCAGGSDMFAEGFDLFDDDSRVGLMPIGETESAIKYYENAITRGAIDAKRELGVFLVTGHLAEDVSKGLSLLEDPAFAQDAGVAAFLGEIYLYGRYNMASDATKAEATLSKAAELGHAKAAFKLGEVYQRGILRFRKDGTKAAKWFDKAATLGNVKAMLELFDMYQHGKGIERNSATARKYLEMAAAKNDPKAKELLVALESASKPAKDFAEFAKTMALIADDDTRSQYCEINKSLLLKSLEKFEGTPSDWGKVMLSPTEWLDGTKKFMLNASTLSLEWAHLIQEKIKGSPVEGSFRTNLKANGVALYKAIVNECGTAPNDLKIKNILEKYEGCYIEIPKVVIVDVGTVAENVAAGSIEWSDDNPLAVSGIVVSNVDSDILKMLNGNEIAPLESLAKMSKHKVAGFISTYYTVKGVKIKDGGFFVKGNVLK